MIDCDTHNHAIKVPTTGQKGGPISRRTLLQGLASYGIMAPTMVNAAATDLSAWSGSSASADSGIPRHQVIGDDDVSQKPGLYPLPFGTHDQEIGHPPCGFFNLEYLHIIDDAFPEPRLWKGQNLVEQTRSIHHWFNQAPYHPEPVKQHLSQPSVSPRSFLKQGGDNEDHILIRYLAFLHLGFHPERLRITALALPASRRATPERHLHTVLCVYSDHDIIVLDHWHRDPYSHQNAFGYRPLFMFNHQRRWLCHPHTVSHRPDLP